MARAAVLGRLNAAWREARVTDVVQESPRARTLALEVPDWPGHRPGQHLDVRLTADDGYRAQRSYSIASAPGDGPVEITVAKLDDGEVSPWFTDVAETGDAFEVRGPIGGYFVWEPERGGPLALVAGGSGLVPLMCMERHRRAVAPQIESHLLLSARSREDILYAGELGDDAVVTLTRDAPADWTGRTGRVDAALLEEVLPSADERPRCFVCGPTTFVEAVAEALVALGHHPVLIKTERFGATGG